MKSKLVQKWGRNRLRLIYKGYKILRRENRLNFLVQLLDVLTKTQLNNVRLPKFLLRENGIDVELSVRQYVSIMSVFRLSFNKALFYSIGANKPLRYPLPKEWRDALVNQKVRVDRLSCAILWIGYGLLIWAYGIVQGFKSVFYLLKKRIKLNRYICFHDLTVNNIPINNKGHTIINWYFQWKNRENDIETVCHTINSTPNTSYSNINIVYTDGLPYLSRIQTIEYCLWFVCLSLYSLLIGLFNPYPAIMLNESLKLTRVRLAKRGQLAKDYLFHNSRPFYRPLWTYEAEKKGARILFYFYSTNGESPKMGKSCPVQYPWHLMSWPYYLVWDKYQANFIKRVERHNSIIEEVGVIWFSSCAEELPIVEKRSIAVFDVTPIRASYYIALGAYAEFYVPIVVNQFLNDIQKVMTQNNYTMTHKMKRTNLNTHKKYSYNIKALRQKSNYQQVHPDLDATQLIQKAAATISMPFTSTALIAKIEGKPSVYYDPSGLIQKNDAASHDIPVLNNLFELQKWVESIKVE